MLMLFYSTQGLKIISNLLLASPKDFQYFFCDFHIMVIKVKIFKFMHFVSIPFIFCGAREMNFIANVMIYL